MMTQHQMVHLTIQVASMATSRMTATIQLARMTKKVTKMFLADAPMTTDSHQAKANKTTVRKVADLAIKKMFKIKVTTNGQMTTANALATASVSAK